MSITSRKLILPRQKEKKSVTNAMRFKCRELWERRRRPPKAG